MKLAYVSVLSVGAREFGEELILARDIGSNLFSATNQVPILR